MKIVAVIQARMSSTRLPGKVLAEVAGKPMLFYVVERVRQASKVNQVVVATTGTPEDDPIVRFCEKIGVLCFRGSENDVLGRYYKAAVWADADVVVRITGDCPLIDPEVIDSLIGFFAGDAGYDYAANINPPTYPDGLDAEVFTFAALETMWREAKLDSEREHVTLFIRNRPEKFRIGNLNNKTDYSHLRWTVDRPRDLEFVRAVYAHFGHAEFRTEDIIRLIEEKPLLKRINLGIERDEGLKKSLREERSAK